jgi:hypothetical protein
LLNKRLKVQHKQIRPKDQQNDMDNAAGGYSVSSGEAGYPGFSTLPPSGQQNNWFDDRQNSNEEEDPQSSEAEQQDVAAELSAAVETSLTLGPAESPLASLGSS